MTTRECLFCHGRGIAWDYYNNTYFDRTCLVCGGTGIEDFSGEPVVLETRCESTEPAEVRPVRVAISNRNQTSGGLGNQVRSVTHPCE